MPNDLGRRDFVKQTGAAALLAGPAVQAARGANGKVNIGWIGLGTRGYYCLEKMYAGNAKNVHVGAVCDTFTGHLARGKDRVQTAEGEAPKAFNDYRDILADPSIDTVFIMTPEHLHYPMMLAALKAGKNIYVEKPLAHTIEQGSELVKAAREIGQGGAGGHAEPQLVAVQEGEGDVRARHARRSALRARLLVSQLSRR